MVIYIFYYLEILTTVGNGALLFSEAKANFKATCLQDMEHFILFSHITPKSVSLA